MFQVILIIHLLLCVLLIAVILKQQGKGADMGAAFGGGNSSSVFGAAGMGDVLVKITVGMAVLFMITSIILARGHREFAASGFTGDPIRGSVLEREIERREPAPAVPAGDRAVTPAQEIPAEEGAGE